MINLNKKKNEKYRVIIYLSLFIWSLFIHIYLWKSLSHIFSKNENQQTLLNFLFLHSTRQ